MTTSSPRPTIPSHVNAIIIGAGQAGLSAAHELQRRGLTPGKDFIILDANDGPGGAWRHRWDSLTLGAAHGIADLPGLGLEEAVPGGSTDSDRPASQVVTEYYGSYEDTFNLAVLRPAKVVDVREVEEGGVLKNGQKPLKVTVIVDGQCSCVETRAVLPATGTWDSPFIPYVPGIDTFRGRQLHTANYRDAEEFRGKKTIVVGGGLSAVQFLLQLRDVTDTVWATRRPPNFTHRTFNATWGLDVERAVRARTSQGERPASVVRTTGIPQIPAYLDSVRDGTLVSHGMFDRITPEGVVFGEVATNDPAGLGPSADDGQGLALPESWQPFPAGHEEHADVIFWNTGFRHSLNHLSPLRLIERSADTANSPARSGVTMADEVRVAGEPRVFLVGYGSTASTIGATRAGRRAGQAAVRFLEEQGG